LAGLDALGSGVTTALCLGSHGAEGAALRAPQRVDHGIAHRGGEGLLEHRGGNVGDENSIRCHPEKLGG